MANTPFEGLPEVDATRKNIVGTEPAVTDLQMLFASALRNSGVVSSGEVRIDFSGVSADILAEAVSVDPTQD